MKDEKVGEGLNKGRWAVVRKVGEGGFAEVYEVFDLLQNIKARVFSTCAEANEVTPCPFCTSTRGLKLPTSSSLQQALKIEKLDKRGSKAGLLKAEHRVCCYCPPFTDLI